MLFPVVLNDIIYFKSRDLNLPSKGINYLIKTTTAKATHKSNSSNSNFSENQSIKTEENQFLKSQLLHLNPLGGYIVCSLLYQDLEQISDYIDIYNFRFE